MDHWVVGSADVVCLYFLQILLISLEKGQYIFSGNLSTRTNLAINFDLVKCITKNKYT